MASTKVDDARLQQAVTDAQKNRPPFATVLDLAYQIAQSNWAQSLDLEAAEIEKMIVARKISTNVKAAGPDPEPAKPRAKAARKKSAPAEPPTPPAEPPALVAEPPAAELPGGEADSSTPVFDEPGRGRKQCPECQKYVGYSKGRCRCGHEFPAAAAEESKPVPRYVASRQEREVKENAAAHQYGCNGILHVPAGKPPAALGGTAKDEVSKWAEAVRQWQRDKDGLFVTSEALRHYARQGCGLNPKDAEAVCGVLAELYPEE